MAPESKSDHVDMFQQLWNNLTVLTEVKNVSSQNRKKIKDNLVVPDTSGFIRGLVFFIEHPLRHCGQLDCHLVAGFSQEEKVLWCLHLQLGHCNFTFLWIIFFGFKFLTILCSLQSRLTWPWALSTGSPCSSPSRTNAIAWNISPSLGVQSLALSSLFLDIKNCVLLLQGANWLFNVTHTGTGVPSEVLVLFLAMWILFIQVHSFSHQRHWAISVGPLCSISWPSYCSLLSIGYATSRWAMESTFHSLK